MVDEQTLNSSQKKFVEDVIRCTAECQAMMYIGVARKKSDGPPIIKTGAHKERGLTVIDMARGVGALAGDIAKTICDIARDQGQTVEFDDALRVVIEHVTNGAKTYKPTSGSVDIWPGPENLARGKSQS